MSHDERADLWTALLRAQRATWLPVLAQAECADLLRLAAYPEGTAGAPLISGYAIPAPDMIVAQSIAHLRAEAPDTETISTAEVIYADRAAVISAPLITSIMDLVGAVLCFAIVWALLGPVACAHDAETSCQTALRRSCATGTPAISSIGRRWNPVHAAA